MLLSTSESVSADDTAQLVRCAQQGDPRSFALLFDCHYAGMLAVARRLLGGGPDAEDACQDAAIAAFSRIGELRDPTAVRPWLHTIVRNNCRTLLRARVPVPVGVAGENLLASGLDDPVARIEQSAMRDWVWHGLQQLSPAAQTVALLRYFTENNSYEQIAELCGTPVGTVRSRLSEARRQLTEILPRVRDERHDGTGALRAERRAEAARILSAVADGASPTRAAARWAEDMVFWWPDGTRTIGREPLFAVIRQDNESGVSHKITGVLAGAGITIWENAFINPPEDPFHCPPGATWLLREKDGLVREVRLLHTPRPPRQEDSFAAGRTSGCPALS
ncbi:RNA polymerase sigma factor [Micromonospora lupini]|uniref:RNA polymerase sigma factor n=1 Tax=Micromonospora lupini TaxID=285679 RepID=UPI0022593CEC|nr:RNA polymerase sigma factor [Micromonospora lupini]MCX5070307.1 RNA polymerase sigma factor [Micromonospora lupini]